MYRIKSSVQSCKLGDQSIYVILHGINYGNFELCYCFVSNINHDHQNNH